MNTEPTLSKPPTRLSALSLAAPDLNAIAAQVRQAQASSEVDPSGEREALVVDNQGQVNFAGDSDKKRPLTVLSQETFAGWFNRDRTGTPAQRSLSSRSVTSQPSPAANRGHTNNQRPTDDRRRQRDAQTVARHFPSGTRWASDGKFSGWVYDITNEFGDPYRFFGYFDPTFSLYKVALLAPKLAGKVGAHEGHLFRDGLVCLNQRGGCRELADAYARSALWCRGASLVRRGHGFQFNTGQGR